MLIDVDQYEASSISVGRYCMKIGDRTGPLESRLVVEKSQQDVDGSSQLNLPGHLRGQGGGLYNRRSGLTDRIAIIFKEQHPKTDLLKECEQKGHRSNKVMLEL